jgi:predicted nucleic acid-binding protein
MIRVGLDTDILAYVVGVDRHSKDRSKIEAARDVLGRFDEQVVLVAPMQVLGELFNVLTRSGADRAEARRIVLGMADRFALADSTRASFMSAFDLASAHKMQMWDALILNAAVEAGCAILLSEDMAEGFSWRGTVVINPLAETRDPRLLKLLA